MASAVGKQPAAARLAAVAAARYLPTATNRDQYSYTTARDTTPAGRALARAIHAEHADIEGLLYSSRLTGQDIYAVFDRGAGKVASVDTGRLEDHPELPEVLERHGIGLIV